MFLPGQPSSRPIDVAVTLDIAAAPRTAKEAYWAVLYGERRPFRSAGRRLASGGGAGTAFLAWEGALVRGGMNLERDGRGRCCCGEVQSRPVLSR